VNEYAPIVPRRNAVGETTGFGKAVESVVELRVEPIARGLENGFKYGATRQEGYTPSKDLGSYVDFADYLIPNAHSPEHMAALKRGIDSGLEYRQQLSDATGFTQFTAGFFDPVNAVALNFGAGASAVRTMLKSGASVAAVEAGAELLTMPFDPLKTAEEATMNVAMAGLGGAAIAGAFATVTGRASLKNTQAEVSEYFKVVRRIENVSDMTPEEIASAPARGDRVYGDLPDNDIANRVSRLESDDLRLQDQSERPSATGMEDGMRTEIQAEIAELKKELGFRAIEEVDVDVNDPFGIKSSWYTDSVFYKALSTPMKRVLQGKLPSSVKEKMVRSFSDSGITLNMNSYGMASPQSVYQRTAASAGKWVAAHDSLIKLWAEDTGASSVSRMDINPNDLARRASRSDNTYRKWLTNLSEKRIKKDQNLSEAEMKGMSVLNDYFENAKERLEEVGYLMTDRGMKNKIDRLENEVAELELRLNEFKVGSYERGLVKGRIEKLKKEAEFTRGLSGAEDMNDVFFPRFYDFTAIRDRRAEFEKIIYKHYEENPYIWQYDSKAKTVVKKELSSRPGDIQERVKKTVDNILGESDPTSIDSVSFGVGRGKHFMSRKLDIPNELISDFIIKDPLAAMKTYAARIEPRYEFSKEFGKELDGVMLDLELDMRKAGVSEARMHEALRDYRHMYGRVVGNILDNPDALNQKAAFALREAASFSYMGGAGLSALPDFGRILLEHDMQDVVKGIQGLLDRERLNMTVDEVRLAGEAIDILKGSAHMRLMEDMSNNIDSNEILNSARNAFYVLNGLSPMTTIAKQLDGIIQAHSLIDMSLKYRDGKLSKQDVERLSRYGISADMAQKIARAPFQKTENGLYMANTAEWLDSIYLPEIDGKIVRLIETKEDGSSVGKTHPITGKYAPAFYRRDEKTIYFDRDYIEGPMFDAKPWLNPSNPEINALPDVFKTPRQWANFVMLHEVNHYRYSAEDLGLEPKSAAYENKINELALKDFKEAQTINQETIDTFRTALNSTVANTIMHGTPADKPIIVDGVAYVPMRVAKKFGMKEDPRYKGYARIENGLMGLPFQFYSFVLANVNKTIGAMAHGQVKNRAIGLTTMMGLSYMSLQLKTPDYIWEDMSWQDRFARSFDQSGIMAIYSDIFYTSMHTSLALGGPNISAGILSPKFKQEVNPLDAVTGLAGAGPSWAYDMTAAMADFLQGNYGEGAKDIVRGLPSARLWMFKDDINQITNAWAN
jgi:hypothetical protein